MSDLTDLEIFVRVVTAGSLSAAGREMGLSPAVVSKRMNRLEARLGTRLIQRTTRQVSVTEAGQGFFERAASIIASVAEAEAWVTGASVEARGVLRISAPTSFGRLHIAPHLGRFMDENPAVVVELELADSFVDLIADGFDVAIRIGELVDSSLVARRLADVHRVLCATPGYLAAHGTPLAIADLARHTCLATRQQDPWRLEGPEGTVSVRAGARLRTNSNEVVREAVLAGLGIALRSTWDVGADLAAGRLKVVLPHYHASHRVGVHAVYPSRRFLPAKVRLFIDYLAALYGTAPYWDAGLEGLPGRATGG